MFLLPGLVIGSYVTGMGFKEEERLEMIRYLMNRANHEDGGWGMYVLFSNPWNAFMANSSVVAAHFTILFSEAVINGSLIFYL
jgi:hypothetical protein